MGQVQFLDHADFVHVVLFFFFLGNIPVTTTTTIFPKVWRYKWEAYCDTDGRRTAIQMGGVLKYFPLLRAQWHQEYCNTNWRCIAIQMGGVLRYFFEK